MRILSYLNISNIDDIESDSGYIFNYTLANSFQSKGHVFGIIIPEKLRQVQTRFSDVQTFYIDMGTTKYESRYRFEWSATSDIISDFNPDILFLNQVELTATFKVLLQSIQKEPAKIFTYCHYPAIHIDSNNEVVIDYTLNDHDVGENIIFNILSAINIADVFAIQSAFARNLLIDFAKKHSFDLRKTIEIIPPPYDDKLYDTKITEKKSNRILYNHRLYDSYGTSHFIDFVAANPDLSFIVTDPMSNRSTSRSKYNNSPQDNRYILDSFDNVKVINGGNRIEYVDAIDTCRLAIAPHRTACVWSMSIVDCFCRGVPVIGPNIAVFKELLPEELLFENCEEERNLIQKLISDDDFWSLCVHRCQERLNELSPMSISGKILNSL